jgi:hypothetical protein
VTYYRRPAAHVVWGVVISLALALALWCAARFTVAAIRASERAAVLREGDALLAQATAYTRVLARERDSLRALVRTADTVLVTRLRTVRDTTWLPAAPEQRLPACLAQLDSLATDCTTYRRAATLALAQADTIRRGDSTVIAGLSLQLAARRRADSLAARPAPAWRRTTAVAVVTAALTLWLSR